MKNAITSIAITLNLIAIEVCMPFQSCETLAYERTNLVYSSRAEEREQRNPNSQIFSPEQLNLIERFHKQKATATQNFWNWFSENEFELAKAESNENSLVNELRAKLRAYNPHLIANLGWTDRALVISPERLVNVNDTGEINPYQSREEVSFYPGRRRLLQITSINCEEEACMAAQTLVLAANLPGQCWQQQSLQSVQLGGSWIIKLGPHPHCPWAFASIPLDANDCAEARTTVQRSNDKIDLVLYLPSTSRTIRGLTEKPKLKVIGPPFPELHAAALRDFLRYILGEYYYQDLLGTISVMKLGEETPPSVPIQSTYDAFDKVARSENLIQPLHRRLRKNLDEWCSQFPLFATFNPAGRPGSN